MALTRFCCGCSVVGHTGPDDHRFLEVLFAGRLIVDVFQLVLADVDNVSVLQRVLFDKLAVDERPICGVQVLQERVVQMVMIAARSADSQIVHLYVILGLTAEGDPLLV